MPLITLTGLAWSAPDGKAIVADLNLTLARQRVGLVGRNGVGKTTVLNLISGPLRPAAGSIAISGTIGMLRQTVQVGADETIADLFGVTYQRSILQRAQGGTATLDELADADWTLDERMAAALGHVGLEVDVDTRLDELSGGQNTRARLAAAVFREPDFLLIDEPTNNLDRGGRKAVIVLLSGWRAGAIVVSHDRALLDTMDAIVELTSLGATRYGGNWSHYRERKLIELESAEHDLLLAEKALSDAGRQAQAARERKDRSDASGARRKAKGDLPRILLGARKNSAEASGQQAARLAERQKAQAIAAKADASAGVENLQTLSISLPPTGLASGRTVLVMDNVTAGYDPTDPLLRDLSLTIAGPERVAFVGANGSGKTTLLKLIAGELKPFSGTVATKVKFALLDQRVSSLDPATSIADNFRRLNAGATENACRSALAGFLFRGYAALQDVGTLSGGQLLRAGLACALGGIDPPQLLILDEPTNHLDIESIEAIEAGLAAYDGALVVVSHDEAFLGSIGVERRLELPSSRRSTAGPDR